MTENVLTTIAISCNGVETSLISCISGGDGGIWTILLIVLNVLTYGIATAGVLGLVLSGIQYMRSAGDPGTMTKAKRRIGQVVIGLFCYGLMWVLLQWMIPGGLISRGQIHSVSISFEQTGQVGQNVMPNIEIDGGDTTYTLISDNTEVAAIVSHQVYCRAQGTAEIKVIAADGQNASATVNCADATLSVETIVEEYGIRSPNRMQENTPSENVTNATEGLALTKEQVERLFDSMATPSISEVIQLGKEVYGLSETQVYEVMAWNSTEGYYHDGVSQDGSNDRYLAYLCSAVAANDMTDDSRPLAVYGDSIVNAMSSGNWGSGYGSRDYLMGRGMNPDPGNLKATWLSFKYPEKRPLNCNGMEIPSNPLYVSNVFDWNLRIYVW